MEPSSCKVFTPGVDALAGRCVGKGGDVGAGIGDSTRRYKDRAALLEGRPG